MTISARRFDTIGFLRISGGITAQDFPALKTWLDQALALKLTLVVDLNSAEFDPAVAGELKTLFQNQRTLGMKISVVFRDEALGTSKTLSSALQLLNTNEARAVDLALGLEDKVRDFSTQQLQSEGRLAQLLQMFGKDMTAVENMKPEDFVKLNRKKTGDQESLFAMYSESIRVLKLLDGAVSVKTVSEEKVKELSEIKNQILSFVQAKGIS